jgi:membrane protein
VHDFLRKFAMRFWRASLGFSQHDGSLVAAGIAYYVALSFYPLMLVLTSGLTIAASVTEVGQTAEEKFFDAIANSFSPDLEAQVKLAWQAAGKNAQKGGIIGAVALLITSIAIFVQIDYAFDRIWHLGTVRQESWGQWIGRHVIARLKALAMLLGVGALLVTMMVASLVWSSMEKVLAEAHAEPLISTAGGIGLNMLLNYFALAIVYRYVPKQRIYWREALAAGLVTAPLWELGRQLLTVYFGLLKYPTAYGIIGSFLAIMLWAYYAMLVVLFGAEYVRVRQHERVGTGSATT